MKHSRGFTIVEIIVTISVMLILMTVAVVGLRSTQANARDQERKTDIENIARGLERLYKTGGNGVPAGTYPGLSGFWDGPAYHQNRTWESYVSGSTRATFTTPSGSYGLSLVCLFANPSAYWGLQDGCQTPETDWKAKEWISPDWYGYEPNTRSNYLCYGNDCSSYTLYWISEVDGQLKKHKSLHK